MAYSGNFTFMESFYRQAELMDEHQRLRYFEAMCSLVFDGVEPDFDDDPILKMAWVPTKDSLIRGIECRRNGAKGGRPRKDAEAKNHPFNPPSNPALKPAFGEGSGEEEQDENPPLNPPLSKGKEEKGIEMNKEIDRQKKLVGFYGTKVVM